MNNGLDEFCAFDELLEKAISEQEYKSRKYSFKYLKEDITYWYHNLFIFDILYNIRNGIKNFWKYRKVIWNDRWYDYYHVVTLSPSSIY